MQPLNLAGLVHVPRTIGQILGGSPPVIVGPIQDVKLLDAETARESAPSAWPTIRAPSSGLTPGEWGEALNLPPHR